MNKYIKTDLEQGLKYFKTGIMNALADIENGVEDEITLEGPALKFIIDCAEERGWETDPDMDWDWTNGWEIDYLYWMITPNGKRIDISGSVLGSNIITISVNHDDE